jgi:mycoredoxin
MSSSNEIAVDTNAHPTASFRLPLGPGTVAVMLRRWGLPGLCLALGALLWAFGESVFSFVAFALLAVLVSPLIFPRSLPAAEAQRRSATDGRPIIYWRPGCPYCMRLRTTLGATSRRAYWVDIWKDPEGAAAVREVADGNETVPTVILAGAPHVNPDPRWLRSRLRGA